MTISGNATRVAGAQESTTVEAEHLPAGGPAGHAAHWTRRHVLDLDDFSAEEIATVLDTAEHMKRSILGARVKKAPTLQGKAVLNVFYEPSTRTRVSFELAAKRLSAEAINLSYSGSSAEKGESLIDTVRTLQAIGADVIVMRHAQSGAPYLVAEHVESAVINAGDGWHAHPTQALLDLFTIRERLGRIADLKVVIVGVILHSRVARSDIWGLTRAGARVTVAGPATLLFNREAKHALRSRHFPHVELTYDFDRAIEGADVVMALRLQKERQGAGLLPSIRDYTRRYQLTLDRLRRAKPSALVMHPGPMNEGVEIAPEVVACAQSVIEDQVTNGVAVRMALLYLLAGSRPAPARAGAPAPASASGYPVAGSERVRAD